MLDLKIINPRKTQWQPKPDITVHELALATPVIVQLLNGQCHQAADAIQNLPEGVRRHFLLNYREAL